MPNISGESRSKDDADMPDSGEDYEEERARKRFGFETYKKRCVLGSRFRGKNYEEERYESDKSGGEKSRDFGRRRYSSDLDSGSENPNSGRLATTTLRQSAVFEKKLYCQTEKRHKDDFISKENMSRAERPLFKYVNTVFETPECVRKCMSIETDTLLNYISLISRYISFLAGENHHLGTFCVDGILVVECLQNLSKEVAESSGFIKDFLGAMELLHDCIGIFETAHWERHRRAIELENWRDIPHWSHVINYAFYAKKEAKKVPQERCVQGQSDDETLQESSSLMQNSASKVKRISITSVKQMREFILHQMDSTGSLKRRDIQKGINSTLEFLLHYHLLLRSLEAFSLRIIDLSYTLEDSERGKVSVLAFKSPEKYSRNAQSSRVRRNKNVEICLISQLALSLWYRFDFGDGHDHSELLEKIQRMYVLGGKNRESRKLLDNTTTPSLEERDADLGPAETYFLARDIDPPEELERLIFPWLEGFQRKTRKDSKELENSRVLEVFKAFRKVILQDLAVLLPLSPNCIYSIHPVVKSSLFIDFQIMVLKISSPTDEMVKQAVLKLEPAIYSAMEILKSGVDFLNSKGGNGRIIEVDPMRERLRELSAPLRQFSELSLVPRDAPRLKRKRVYTPLTEEMSKKFKMSRRNSTIPSLLEEWYNGSETMPSVEERDRLYWWTWRQGSEQAYFNKRKALVRFIERLPELLNLGLVTRSEMGDLMEEYRKKRNLGIQALSLSLKPGNIEYILKELRELWEKRTPLAQLSLSQENKRVSFKK